MEEIEVAINSDDYRMVLNGESIIINEEGQVLLQNVKGRFSDKKYSSTYLSIIFICYHID